MENDVTPIMMSPSQQNDNFLKTKTISTNEKLIMLLPGELYNVLLVASSMSLLLSLLMRDVQYTVNFINVKHVNFSYKIFDKAKT